VQHRGAATLAVARTERRHVASRTSRSDEPAADGEQQKVSALVTSLTALAHFQHSTGGDIHDVQRAPTTNACSCGRLTSPLLIPVASPRCRQCRRSCRRFGNPNDPDRPKPDPPSFRKVLSLAKDDKPLLCLGLFCLCLASMCTLSLPTLAGQVVDVVHVGADPEALRIACVQLAVIAVAGGLCAGGRGYIFSVCGERLAARLRKRLFAAIIAQETGFFDTSRTGELINRLSSDTQVIQSALTVNISMLVRGGIQATMALGMIFYTSWKLSLIMVAIIPVIIFIATRFGKFVKRVQGEVQDALAAATTASEECMSSIRTVRSFSREEMEIERYAEKISVSYDLGVTLAKGYGGFIAVMFGISQSAIALVLYAGGSFVISGDLTVGQLASFLLYVVFVAASLGMLTSVYGDFMKAVGASGRVFELLEREPAVNYKGGQKGDQAFGSIELHDVHFAYPSRSDYPVLKGLSLEVKPGSVVALVGPSGGGKSTVFQLIERFYLPNCASLSLISNYSCLSLLSLIALITLITLCLCLLCLPQCFGCTPAWPYLSSDHVGGRRVAYNMLL
jgi:ABC-type multidrug transport system fused ATPase/permease subunit